MAKRAPGSEIVIPPSWDPGPIPRAFLFMEHEGEEGCFSGMEVKYLLSESSQRSALVQEYVSRTLAAGEELDPDEIRGFLYGDVSPPTAPEIEEPPAPSHEEVHWLRSMFERFCKLLISEGATHEED